MEGILSKRTAKHEPLYYRVLSHPFVVSELENMSAVLDAVKEAAESTKKEESSEETKKQAKNTQKKWTPTRPALTSEQEYHVEVSQYMNSLIHTIERLEEIPIYLGRFSNSPAFEKNGITLHKWIHYHYSNYLINTGTIYDTALLLTNAVFLLGLSPKHCKEETVAKNKKVQGSKVKAAIDKVKEVTRKYSEPRNLFVHRGILPTLEELDEYESLRFIHEKQEEFGIKAEPIMPIWVVEHIYKSERRKLIHTLQGETKSIIEAVVEFFDALEPIYAAFTKHLKK